MEKEALQWQPQSQAWYLLLPQLATGAHPWDLALLVVRVESSTSCGREHSSVNQSQTAKPPSRGCADIIVLLAWWNFLVGTALVIPKQLPTCECLCWWCHHKC